MLVFVCTTGLAKPGCLTLQRPKRQEVALNVAEGARGEYAVWDMGPVDFLHRHRWENPLVTAHLF